DLLILHELDRGLEIRFNDGHGGFGEAQELDPAAGYARLFPADVGGHGDLDIVAPRPVAADLLRNPRPLGLASVDSTLLVPAEHVAVADLDGLGRRAIVVANSELELLVVRQQADGTLAEEVGIDGGPFTVAALEVARL